MDKERAPLKVVAQARGVYGGVVREIGESFTIASEGDLGAWMTPEGWEPQAETLPEPASTIDVLALEAELQFLRGERQSDARNLDAAFAQRDEEKARADSLSAEVDGNKAVFDAIRAELAKAEGLPVDLNLAEAVGWLVAKLDVAPKPTAKK